MTVERPHVRFKSGRDVPWWQPWAARLRVASPRWITLAAGIGGLVVALLATTLLIGNLRGKVAGLVTENAELSKKLKALTRDLDARTRERDRLSADLRERDGRIVALDAAAALRPAEIRFRFPPESFEGPGRPRQRGPVPTFEITGTDRPLVLEIETGQPGEPLEGILFSDSGSIAWSGGGLVPPPGGAPGRIEIALPAGTLRSGAGYELRIESRQDAGEKTTLGTRFRVVVKKG